MPPFVDLTGQKFNRLTIIRLKHFNKKGNSVWHCLCECGKTTDVCVGGLTTNHTKSCGCLQKEKVRGMNTTHGMSRTKEYKTWIKIKQRCYNPNNNRYYDYGGRGIKVCNRWLNSFVNFYKDMGLRPDDCDGIDRIDNNSGYKPSNCKWATTSDNNQHKRNSFTMLYNGKIYNCAQLSKKLNISFSVLKNRHLKGLKIDAKIGELRNANKK